MRLNKLLAALLVSISFLFAPLQSAYAEAQTYNVTITTTLGEPVGQSRTVSYEKALELLTMHFFADPAIAKAHLDVIIEIAHALNGSTFDSGLGVAASSGGGQSASPSGN